MSKLFDQIKHFVDIKKYSVSLICAVCLDSFIFKRFFYCAQATQNLFTAYLKWALISKIEPKFQITQILVSTITEDRHR